MVVVLGNVLVVLVLVLGEVVLGTVLVVAMVQVMMGVVLVVVVLMTVQAFLSSLGIDLVVMGWLWTR